MAKIRVAEVARAYGMPSKAILQFLQARGEFVKAASSTLNPAVLGFLEEEFGPLPEPAPTFPDASLPTLAPSPARRPNPLPRVRAANPFRRPALAPRAEPVVPTAVVTFAEVEAGLNGSPYSLPGEQREYVEDTFLPLVSALHTRAAVARRRISTTGRRALGRITRTSEIYQSNKIEGLGPDIATTDRLLHDYSLDGDVGVTVAQQAIQQCIDAEPKVRDVVGLGAAKILAELFCSDTERSLTESDVRQLHELIMVGDARGGCYKEWTNEIGGSNHVPPNPTDARLQMHDLMAWLNTTDLSPLWRAAVAHAWLTYIHPFHDGNGRVARLLANLILIRHSLPPLIVRAQGDRGAYLEALAASDEGGNILPLSRVFRRIVQRAVKDLEDPTFAQRLFEAEIERRYEPLYDRWLAATNAFLNELAAHLLLQRMTMEQVGGVGNEEFTRFRSGTRQNVWVAKVHVQGKSQDLLLHIAQPSARQRRDLERDEVLPSIYVSIRNQRPLDAKPYLPVGREQFSYEFTPLVDTGLVLVRAHNDARRVTTADAAGSVALYLERVARQLIVR